MTDRDRLLLAAKVLSWFLLGLAVCVLVWLLIVREARASAQTTTPAPFVETVMSTEYHSPETGKTWTGRLTVLKHRATGECWIVYPSQGIAPAPRAVCPP